MGCPLIHVHDRLCCMCATHGCATNSLRPIALAAAAPYVALPAGPPAAQHFMPSMIIGRWVDIHLGPLQPPPGQLMLRCVTASGHADKGQLRGPHHSKIDR